MSQENKEPRSIPEIQQDYQSLCTKAGHLNYQIHALSKDLELVNNQLRELNFEAASAKAKESEQPKEEPKQEEVKEDGQS